MARVLQLPILKKKSEITGGAERELFPVPLRLFRPGQEPPCPIYFKPLGHRRAGGGGAEEAWGYFDPADAGPLVIYLSARLKETEAAADTSAVEKARFVYDTAVVWIQHVFHGSSEKLTAGQLHLAEHIVRRLYALLSEAGPREAAALVRRHDAGLFTHSVNVCLLGLAFTRHLGWPAAEAEVFGLGALLHDIGMVFLPRELWTKTGPISAEEREAIRTHPQRGVQLLEKFSDLPGTIFYMAAQHHETGDSSGYPLGLPEQAIHPWATLLRLLDTYEAMTSIRPWRAPLDSPKALQVLKHGAGGTSLAPALLDRLGEFLET
ncbi:MAG: HD domain-containing phosphohydrolase [Deltaproteobacteria bacterium]|nr:HD domain-containing phosphohydrolase [Deltaproteobacteria bacterium]